MRSLRGSEILEYPTAQQGMSKFQVSSNPSVIPWLDHGIQGLRLPWIPRSSRGMTVYQMFMAEGLRGYLFSWKLPVRIGYSSLKSLCSMRSFVVEDSSSISNSPTRNVQISSEEQALLGFTCSVGYWPWIFGLIFSGHPVARPRDPVLWDVRGVLDARPCV